MTGGVLDREARTIEVQAVSSETVPDAAVKALEHLLAEQYDLRRVQLRFSAPQAAGKGGSDLLYGKEIKGKVIPIAREVERRLQGCTKPITVAVMGCVVNGPGEASGADVGIAGGVGEGLLFAKGRILRKVPQEQLVDALFQEIDKL